MTKANDYQVAGHHYRQEGTIQHWDYAASHNFDYFQGQITKYVTRWKKKNGIADLEKARHFIEKYIEVEKAKVAGGEAHSFTKHPETKKTCAYTGLGQLHPFGYDAETEGHIATSEDA